MRRSRLRKSFDVIVNSEFPQRLSKSRYIVLINRFCKKRLDEMNCKRLDKRTLRDIVGPLMTSERGEERIVDISLLTLE